MWCQYRRHASRLSLILDISSSSVGGSGKPERHTLSTRMTMPTHQLEELHEMYAENIAAKILQDAQRSITDEVSGSIPAVLRSPCLKTATDSRTTGYCTTSWTSMRKVFVQREILDMRLLPWQSVPIAGAPHLPSGILQSTRCQFTGNAVSVAPDLSRLGYKNRVDVLKVRHT